MSKDADWKAEKMTITFADGHTEDFDVFMAVVAVNLLPAGRDGETVCYTAPESGFGTRGITAIAATSEVIIGLIGAVMTSVSRVIECLPPEAAPGLVEALLSLRFTVGEQHTDTKTIIRKSGDN